MLTENITAINDGVILASLTSIGIMLLKTSDLNKAQGYYWSDLQNVSERTEKHLSEQKRESRCLWSCTLAAG